MISFTDDQLKQITQEYVQYSDIRASLLQGKDLVLATLDMLTTFDQGQKQWTDLYLSVASAYGQELKLQTASLKALFAGESEIVEAAQRSEVYFPATPPNIWRNLPPKIAASHNGSPSSPFTGLIEPDSILGVDAARQLITAGFSDGSHSSQLEIGYTIGQTTMRVDEIQGFGIGQRILITNGTVGMFAKIIGTNPDGGSCSGETNPPQLDELSCTGDGGIWTQPPEGEITIEILSPPSANLPAGSNITNNASGFSNGEREGTVGMTPSREATLEIFKGVLDDSVQNWEDFLNNDLTPVLNGNDDQKRKAEIQAEKDAISSKIVEIDAWQSFPSDKTGPTESRFGDIKLTDLQGYYNNRSSDITARIGLINAALGSVAQNPADGKFTGAGVLFDYFDWFNKRCHAATGSLSQYYNTLRAVEVSDQKIADLDSSKLETETILFIAAFTADADGTNIIKVSDVTGLSINDTISIIAEGQAIITADINNISGNDLELSVNITSDFSLSNVARLSKEL